jgi:hypothetical protein
MALLGDDRVHTGMARSLRYRWFTDPAARSIYPNDDHPLHDRLITSSLRQASRRKASAASHRSDRGAAADCAGHPFAYGWPAICWSRLATERLSTVDGLSMNLSLNCCRRLPPHAQQAHVRSTNTARGAPLDVERPAVNRQVTGSSPVGGVTTGQ